MKYNLELTAEECQALAGLLTCCVEEMRTEIHHTENLDYKEELKQRKEMILSLLERVQAQLEIHAA